jgi:hypothetical protein
MTKTIAKTKTAKAAATKRRASKPTRPPPVAKPKGKDETKLITSYEQPAPAKPLALTIAEYGGLQDAYTFFNDALFNGVLPDVMITLARRAGANGYYRSNQFSDRSDGVKHYDELCLNPDTFIGRTDAQICSTLVHEQCHGWQTHHGKPSRGYHNREWAARMKSVGLQPSSTGAVGGKETGARVSHYIIPGAAYEKVFERLQATGWKLNLQSTHRTGPKGKRDDSKTKYTCPSCQLNMWGKPASHIKCEECGDIRMPPAGGGGPPDATSYA